MISVIIPARNAERTLAATLSALVPSAVDGLVKQVIVVDGGSTDSTADVADQAGADVVVSTRERGGQLAQGAAMARFPWLLFLHAGTVLEEDWDRSAIAFMRGVDLGERALSAGAFTFRLDDKGIAPRVLEGLVHLRCKVLRVPYGDQGLLIPRQLFDAVGGYKNLPIMEDIDLARRLGRRRLTMLDANAVTSAEQYKREGYLLHSMRSQICQMLYGAGLPIGMIARLHGNIETAP
ncbi:MAG: TIGR04283 family arsenosugar biosynthesis glycosyltransferase [Proteobacteria bacterium]|nr:TIGR04283 family arsenosugar biosynthesis glycosyltransferase [Pseudomonadota bacterium]